MDVINRMTYVEYKGDYCGRGDVTGVSSFKTTDSTWTVSATEQSSVFSSVIMGQVLFENTGSAFGYTHRTLMISLSVMITLVSPITKSSFFFH